MTDTRRILELSDIHFPYHDPYAVNLATRVVGMWQPDVVIINGDAVDFYAVSAYDRDPNQLRAGGLQREVDCLGEFLGELNRVKPAAAIVQYLPGNHEDRLRRYLWRHSELYGLSALELPNLLQLDKHGVQFFPDEIELAGGELVVKHGTFVRKWGGLSALAELENEKYSVSTITGHTHRIGFTMIRTRHHLIGGWEGGCLCDLKPEYVKHPNWQQGVTLITETTGSNHFSVTQVPFTGEGQHLKATVEGNTVRL